MKTRPSNAGKHLGLPDKPNHRCTGQEKAAAEAVIQKAQTYAAVAKAKKELTVAVMEQDIVEADTQQRARRVTCSSTSSGRASSGKASPNTEVPDPIVDREQVQVSRKRARGKAKKVPEEVEVPADEDAYNPDTNELQSQGLEQETESSTETELGDTPIPAKKKIKLANPLRAAIDSAKANLNLNRALNTGPIECVFTCFGLVHYSTFSRQV